jgi:hypothetical protein
MVGDHNIHGDLRVAHLVAGGGTARDVDVADLQAKLAAQGVYLGTDMVARASE